MTEQELEDYRLAPSGEGPLANQWKDKPHRLVYDLVAEIRRLKVKNEHPREDHISQQWGGGRRPLGWDPRAHE